MRVEDLEQNKDVQVIMYIADRLKQSPTYGYIVLNKMLYFSDSIMYLKTGTQITSFTYVKQIFGPTPKPSQFLSLRSDMIRYGLAKEVNNEFFGKLQKRLIPLKAPILTKIQPEELSLMNEVIDDLQVLNGRELSDMTHLSLAYRIPELQEEIPISAYMLAQDEVSDDDIRQLSSERSV